MAPYRWTPTPTSNPTIGGALPDDFRSLDNLMEIVAV